MTAEMILSLFRGDFWTVQSEMVDDIEEQGFEVIDYNDEYVAILDEPFPGVGTEYILYLGHANSTMWIESVREN